MLQHWIYWIIFVTYNIGIYIFIYIYKVSYIHSFIVIFNGSVFLHLVLNILRYEKIFCKIDEWNLIKWCDVLGVHSESIFPFMQFFFLQKTVFLSVYLSLAYCWVNQLRYFCGVFLKIASFSWVILSISLDQLNSNLIVEEMMMKFLEIIFIL